MERNSTRDTLAWFGVGCSLITLVILACPGCMVTSGAMNYFGEPQAWAADDNVMVLIFGGLLCLGVLFILVAGGLSLYYLITGEKKE